MNIGESRKLFETRVFIVRIDRTNDKNFPYEIYLIDKLSGR